MAGFKGNLIRLGSLYLVLLVITITLSIFVLTPRLQMRSDAYIPERIAQLKVGVLKLQHIDGQLFEVPVRIIDTEEARAAGPGGVGPLAMKTMLLYYSFTAVREPTSYNTSGLRDSVSIAVFDETRKLIEVLIADESTDRIEITVRHRALLIAKEPLFALFDLHLGALIPQNALRWIR